MADVGAWLQRLLGRRSGLPTLAGSRATFLELLKTIPASAVDAVLVSHGHADHCADLNPLLRARHLSEDPPAALPLFTLAGALDAVLSLDGQMLANDFVVNEFSASDDFTIGPFRLSTRALSHFVPNVGVRLSVGEIAVCYTGDGGADPAWSTSPAMQSCC